jgi:hypothetical protein
MRGANIFGFLFLSISVQAASVTLVTHGLDSNANGWVLDLCRDIRAYQNALQQEADVYRVILPRQSMILRDPQFQVVQDTFTSTNANKNAIVAFDWSYYSQSIIFGVGIEHATWTIAPYVANLLLKTNALPSISEPLARRSIHLIGHSRGGSLISGAGDLLVASNIVIEHFTTLDPRAYPFSTDTEPHVPANVMFADNYYQTYDTLTYGVHLQGAYNRKPILFDNYILVGSTPQPIVRNGHENIHHWYHRTVREWNLAGDQILQNLYKQWFSTSDNGGWLTGYYFENCAYGTRPIDGFRARRLKRPVQLLGKHPSKGTLTFSSSGDATGRYSLQGSTNLATGWITSTNTILFDGRPFSSEFMPSQPLLFYRLISTEDRF